MRINNTLKYLFLYYLATILVASILILCHSGYELAVVFNFIENCFFAAILIAFSFFIRQHTLRRYYALLAYFGFCVTLIFETIYYMLYKSFISASTLFLIFDTNREEASEFLLTYFGIFELAAIFMLLICSVFFLKKIYYRFQDIEQISLTYSIKMAVLLGLSMAYLKFSSHIIYNLPYLIIKSYTEYAKVSDRLNSYKTSKNGPFVKANSSLIEHKEGVYVLILGESTTRSHMGIYGYNRETTPLLSTISEEIWTYKDIISPNAHTIESVTKMLTLGHYESPENILNGSIIQLANAAGFETIWLSNQRPIGMHESLVTKIARSASKVKFMTAVHGRHNRTLDQSMLVELEAILEKPTTHPKLIIIHLAGTHMFYQNRYPKSKQIFTDIPEINFKSDANFETVNHYDNAILNTDYVVSEIIDRVKQLNSESVVLYLSDHGEELFQERDFAGHNEDAPTKSMFDIPFLLWQSEQYKKEVSLFFDPNRQYMTDDFFHSMADLLRISHASVDSTRSVFSKDFSPRKRLILKGKNYDHLFSKKDD